MNEILCECVDTKIGSIRVKSGKKPVFIFELVSDTGELFIKFFNANKTPKGNYSVARNSDFARLYRLSTGNNPIKKFSECQKLIKHMSGYMFLASFEAARDRRGNEYNRVIALKPAEPIISGEWTITGHLIKGVRQPGKNWGHFGENPGKNWGKTGESNSTSGQVNSGATAVFNPIQHLPCHIEAYQVGSRHSINTIKGLSVHSPPTDSDLKVVFDSEFEQKYLF
ncbi:hypothetical protein [Methylotuvimicrobium sp. KM2]|uniref:hypothetical protein n=1 Tax=Methylotuvimicrobium sp. KM2 TaxID=3133976 RepID=UPI003100BAD8